MDRLYNPLQRLLTSPTSRRIGSTVVNVLRCGRKSQKDKEREEETALLHSQVERMNTHTQGTLRRRLNVPKVRTIPKPGKETQI